MGQSQLKGGHIDGNLALFDEKRPWVYLLQKDIQWHQVQQKVDSAALLSPNITPAGWYICPANTSKEILNYLGDVINFDSEVVLSAETIDSLIPEFMELVQKRKSGQSLPKIKSVSDKVLKEVNAFLASRGSNNSWKVDDYVRILNTNLQIVSSTLLKDTLPANEFISVEVIYGLLIAHYGENILYGCPQLAVLMVSIPLIDGLRPFANKDFSSAPPKIRKMASLKHVMQKKRNLPIPDELYSKSFGDTEELSTELKKVMQRIKDEEEERKIRVCGKKQLHRLRDLIHLLDTKVQVKQEKYDVRKEIVSEHLSFSEDYRLHSDKCWEIIFFEGLKQSLNRIPTDIGVYNNATLRDPNKHIVTRFLKTQNEDLEDYMGVSKRDAIKKLEFLAKVVRNARKLGYFVSDWQNKLARKWSKLRAEVMTVIKQQKENAKTSEDLRVPPPLQYCLALDLNPEAHPFSFTYGRQQGYCVDYENSLYWYLNSCNNNEKSYFYSLLENPDCHESFSFLNEIPEEIRKPPKPFDNSKESAYIKKIDDWIVKQSTEKKDLQTLKRINGFIQKKLDVLPEYLKTKTIQAINKKHNVIALFDSIFQVYYPEEVYLEKTLLPSPVIVDQTEDTGIGQLNSLSQNSSFDQQLLGFWGPPKYGGKI